VKRTIPTGEKESFLREEESLPSEKFSLKSNFLSIRERPSRSRPSLLKEKKNN